MADSISNVLRTPGSSAFTGLFLFPLTQTRGDETPDVRPSFGVPVSVDAVLNYEGQSSFVDFYYSSDGPRDKHELYQRCWLQHSQFFKAGPTLQMWVVDDVQTDMAPKTPKSKSFAIQFRSQAVNGDLYMALQDLKAKSSRIALSKFEKKIEASSAKMYFHYYGQLLHQQNMLQDYVRTGTYYAAVIENHQDFQGRVVLDVGAGSGILSLFAAQAGAQHVYAVEASSMAEYARKLIAGNHPLAERITVIHGKIEEVELPEKADILISEPMGTLLVNERMLESYIIARDRFLVPNGKMFPSVGRIHMAPFSDEYLYSEIANKALFWQQQSYYGVDLTPLHGSAFQGYFSQPVVDAFDPRLLIAPAAVHIIDFTTTKEEDLYEIDVPLKFQSAVSARVHGLACWFDVLFDGSKVQRWLTTAPGAPTTHWYQLRCVLSQPLYVLAGQPITGHLHLIAHSSQSYTIHLTMSASSWGPGAGAGQGGVLQTASAKLDLKEPYYRMTQSPAYAWSQQDQQQFQPQQQQVQQALDGTSLQQAAMLLQQQTSQSAVSPHAVLQQQQFTVSSVVQMPQQMPQQSQQYYQQNYWAS